MEFKQHAAHKGQQSLVKEAIRFREEMGVSLDLQYPKPKCSDSRGNAEHQKLTENGSHIRDERNDPEREYWQIDQTATLVSIHVADDEYSLFSLSL